MSAPALRMAVVSIVVHDQGRCVFVGNGVDATFAEKRRNGVDATFAEKRRNEEILVHAHTRSCEL